MIDNAETILTSSLRKALFTKNDGFGLNFNGSGVNYTNTP
jgi:hypothetical protein